MKNASGTRGAALVMCAAVATAGEPTVRENRLAAEASPYLLQHKNNPVDWYPWGEEAFAAARERGVPVFLSIGYSTCYWCHVMERESFEHEPTAEMMNAGFVCIKVDREERPDIDDLYMTATQLMTGGGGWPMSVFIDPETRRPFYCGTYFPREPMHGRPSFRQALGGISQAWRDQRATITEQAGKIAEAVGEHLAGAALPAALGPDQISGAVEALLRIHDRSEGGFSTGGPKFPQPVYLDLLMDALERTDDPETIAAISTVVRFTLDRMAIGGLFDQVGGGFHRYCVDGTWTVPHFEKMLYDNAQLLAVYARAAMVFDDVFYRNIAERTFGYVAREMTALNGLFFSAQDAEVDGLEGLNYLWLEHEFHDALGADDAAFAARVYGMDVGPNFKDPHHPDEPPRRVLRLEDRPEDIARAMSADDFEVRLASINAALLEARSTRKAPGLDDKSIAAWNGMMIAAMADASRNLDDRGMLAAAVRAAEAMLATLRDDDGRLYRAIRGDRVGGEPVLEDYAHAASGCIAIYRAIESAQAANAAIWLDAARDLVLIAKADYADDRGVFYDTPAGREDVFVRARSSYDGAMPSGVSALILALVALSDLDPYGPWRSDAVAAMRGVSASVAASPVATVNSVRGLLRLLSNEDVAAELAVGEAMNAGRASHAIAAGPSGIVEVLADTEAITVADDRPATLALVIKIADGYHIVAAEPTADGSTDPGLMPLRVGLVRGRGVAVYADYPVGDPYSPGDLGGIEILVHGGTLRLTVVVEKADGVGPTPGAPVLGVTLQACSDTACEAPRTIELGVTLLVE